MAKLKKRIHKDTMKLSGMVNKKVPKPVEGVKKKLTVVHPKKKTDHFRPPAANELRALQEGCAQSHYNFFRLQADEFLAAVHRKQEHVQGVVNQWLISFNSFIDDLKADEEKYDLSQQMPWLKKVVVPFASSTTGLKGTVRFVPPKTEAFLIGSQVIGTSAPYENTVTVDVAVEMPKEFFQTADYLNFTYHYKKALYMSYVLELARKTKFIPLKSAQFTYLGDNPMQPAILVSLEEDGKVNIKVQLHFCMEQGVYKLNRFIPARNNIRAMSFDANLSEDIQNELNSAPTYHYNNSILRDLVLKENDELMVALIAKYRTVSDALVLLKYWLRRRKLNTVMNGYMLSSFMCHLIQAKKVNPTVMNYYQIIRIFFSHFHLTDMQKRISLCDSSAGFENTPTYSEIRMFSELCFIDKTGFYNIFARINMNDMKRIIVESGKSLQMLDKSQSNAFQWLFLSDVPDNVVFDHLFHVECTSKVAKKMLKSDVHHLEKILLFGVDTKSYLMDLISRILSKGLGQRIQVLQCVRDRAASWSVSECPSERNSHLMFGVILNPEFAFEVIVKGPQANDPAAEEFRAFWGEKSQLRRFKDGSVTEACVFGSSQDSPSEKRMVTARIVEHLLKEHLSFITSRKAEPLWSLSYFADQLKCIVRPNKKNNTILDLETQSLAVIREFNEVEMELRRLEGLPLEITGILGVSPIFYYSDPRRNAPNGFMAREDKSIAVIYGEGVYDAILTLSVSGKWPEDLQAIQRLKSAFYLEIERRMRHQKGFFCRVAVDGIYILKSGFAFRFKLAHSKELQLMRQLSIDGVVAYRDTRESLMMEKGLFIKPTVASALHGLHQQHNAFGPTVCLVKAWLNSQLLDNTQWPDECTELLVASLFMDDTKTVTSEAPVQPQTGFMRFLHLMANKNWETEFVVLNFNESMAQERINEVQSSFTSNRNQYPPITVLTSFDEKFTGIWAKDAPILQVLIRVIMLSKELLRILSEKVTLREEFSNESVFVTQYNGYDAVITLNVDHIKFIKQTSADSINRLPADFDPVEIYLKELRSAYGEVALFFCNGIAPQKIGVLWKPSVDVPRDFRISEVNGRTLVNNQLVFDKKAILNDFLLIGHGLVVSVQ